MRGSVPAWWGLWQPRLQMKFTLTDTSYYCEYHFQEMKETFHLPGMDKWVMVDKMVDGTKEEGDCISSPPEKMQT